MVAYSHLRFKMYGVTTPGTPDNVDARAFSEKLGILLAALGAADRAANGKVMYDFRIVRTEVSSMDFEIQEFLKPRYRKRPNETSIGAFDACISAVASGRPDIALRYGACSRYVSKLGRGAGSRFAFAELWSKGDSPFLVDEVLAEQALAIVAPAIEGESSETEKWFRGFVFGGFDGSIKEVDFRGSLPQGKLVLSAGSKKEIDCVFRDVDADEILQVTNKRARVEGRAYYDGKSGLPRRIEISNVPRLIKQNADFLQWKGAFTPFGPTQWEEVN